MNAFYTLVFKKETSMLMFILLETGIGSNYGSDIVIAAVTGLVSLVGGYIIIRERILKTEMRLNAMSDYVDRKSEILDNKIKAIHDDISDFKELNKETSKSLVENTAAIRELKLVLDLLKEQLGVKGMKKLRTPNED